MFPRHVTPALPLLPRQVAQACAWTLVAGGAAAQTAAPPSTELPAVTVHATPERAGDLPEVAPGGKTARGARLGVLGNVSLMDAPFNVTAYTAQHIDDRQARTLGAVLKDDPSIRTMTNEGHLVENFSIRGFPVGSSSMAINGLFGLAGEQNTPTEMFERVEVLKGPGAMMMGLPPTGDVGGVVNLVPKRAGAKPLTRFTGTFWGRSNVGGQLDVSRRLGAESQLGVRFNGALSGGETWLDHQTQARDVAHLAVDYQGRRWKAEVDVYAFDTTVRKGSPMQPVLTNWTTVPAAPDGATNFFYGEDVYGHTKTVGAMARGEAELSGPWTLMGAAGTADHAYDGFIFGTRPNFPVANAASGRATGTAYNSWGEFDARSAELGVRGQLATGPVAHRLTVSAHLQASRGGTRDNGTAPIDSNLYQPTPISMPAATAPSTYRQTVDTTSRALSVVDTLGFADDLAQLTLGLRAQEIEQKVGGYEGDAVTPLVGLVVKPWGEAVSLYGNYVEGLSPGVTVAAPYANEGASFAPYKTKQAEAGVKWAAGGALHTLGVFQITKPSMVVVDNRQLPDGEQRNRGIEWTSSGRVGAGLTVLGGIARTEAKQTRTQGGVHDGRDAVGVPEVTANLSGDWAVPWVPGLSLHGRVIYTGPQWLDAANTVEMPSWTTLDAGLHHRMQVDAQTLTVRLTVRNLTDKAHFESAWGAGRVNVGAPRSVHLSLSLDV